MAPKAFSALRMALYAYFSLHKPPYRCKTFIFNPHAQHSNDHELPTMPEAAVFKAYDLDRKNPRTMRSSPVKIRQHRVNKREWESTRQSRESIRKSPRRTSSKPWTIPTAESLLREEDDAVECLQCGRKGDDTECDASCYHRFAKEKLQADIVDIRGGGPFGYGAFTKPGTSLKKDQWLGEYVGDLVALNEERDLRYCVVLPGKCIIDAEKAGNWTRFANSSCAPNVRFKRVTIGKRIVILFQAARNIGPETELTVNYGRGYFKSLGFECWCLKCQQQKKITRKTRKRKG